MNQPPSTRFHCFRNDAMADNDATALAERIRSGEVSAQEVTAAAIERAQLAAPVINGVVAERYQPALTQSQRPGAQTGPPFAGVPTYIKDNTDVEGLPTGHGSKAVTPPRVAKRTSLLPNRCCPRAIFAWASPHCRNSVLTPQLSPPRETRHATHGTWTIPVALHPAVLPPWSQPAWCPSPTPMTVAALSAYRLPVAVGRPETYTRPSGR